MPIYEYETLAGSTCDFCENGFELIQKLSEPDLHSCPECGQAVRRIISAPNISKSGGDLNPANVEKHGFTQYRKSGKGVYEKTAGKGPRVISADPD